ncbi:MAG: hypothetical protein JNL94_00425 [Planctomycetes bacterium]|nr:hypothetical protein [Planctomycetota bacterium]
MQRWGIPSSTRIPEFAELVTLARRSVAADREDRTKDCFDLSREYIARLRSIYGEKVGPAGFGFVEQYMDEVRYVGWGDHPIDRVDRPQGRAHPLGERRLPEGYEASVRTMRSRITASTAVDPRLAEFREQNVEPSGLVSLPFRRSLLWNSRIAWLRSFLEERGAPPPHDSLDLLDADEAMVPSDEWDRWSECRTPCIDVLRWGTPASHAHASFEELIRLSEAAVRASKAGRVEERQRLSAAYQAQLEAIYGDGVGPGADGVEEPKDGVTVRQLRWWPHPRDRVLESVPWLDPGPAPTVDERYAEHIRSEQVSSARPSGDSDQ